MPETKWTKGPWEVFRGGNFVRVGALGYRKWTEDNHYLGGPLKVAEAAYEATEDYSPNPELALANANLIAAAPDMYKALKAFADWPVEHPVSYLEFESLRRNAISVLAKAEGR